MAGGMAGEAIGARTGYTFAGPVGGAIAGGYIGEKLMAPKKKKVKQALDMLRASLSKLANTNAESEVPVPANLEEPSDREKALEQNKRLLRKAVSKFSPLYKTRSAQGWDVLAESIATDDQATAAGHA